MCISVASKELMAVGNVCTLGSGNVGEGVHPPGILYECQNKGVAKFDGCKCMKRKGNGREEVSSKMGKMPWSSSAQERIKKSARRSDRIGIFEHGGASGLSVNNDGESIAHLNEDVKCFAVNGRK